MSTNVGRAFGFTGDEFTTRLDGQTATFVIRPNDSEIARRARFGLGAVTERDLLSILGSLPLGLAVSWADIDPVLAAVLDTAPSGVVAIDQTTVTRTLRPAIHLDAVYVRDRNWRRGLERVSLFAPDAPRALLLEVSPRDLDAVGRLASRLGVGVVLPDGTIIGSCSRRFVRVSVRRWRVLELLYRRWSAELLRSRRAV